VIYGPEMRIMIRHAFGNERTHALDASRRCHCVRLRSQNLAGESFRKSNREVRAHTVDAKLELRVLCIGGLPI